MRVTASRAFRSQAKRKFRAAEDSRGGVNLHRDGLAFNFKAAPRISALPVFVRGPWNKSLNEFRNRPRALGYGPWVMGPSLAPIRSRRHSPLYDRRPHGRY